MLFLPPLMTMAVVQQAGASAPRTSAALFTRAAQRLAEHPSLVADFEITTTYASDYLDTREIGQVSLARPGQLRITLNRQRRVKEGQPWEPTGNGAVVASDGQQTWNVTTHPLSAQYETQPLSDTWLTSALGSLTPLSGFFSGSALPQSNAVGAAQQTIAGETFEVAVARLPGETSTYYFDTSGFLRRIVTERDASAKAPGGRASFTRREVRLSPPVRLTESEGTRFAYAPPDHAVRIERRAPASLTSTDSVKTAQVGETAPELVVEDVDGRPVTLSDFAGKPVVVKFWATWCWPCRQSLPETEQLAKENDGTVTVLAVALWDSRASFRQFVRQYAAQRHTTPEKLPIRFVFDPRPQGQDAGTLSYRVRSTPTQFVLDKKGTIVLVDPGYAGPSDRVAAALAALLGTSPAKPSG